MCELVQITDLNIVCIISLNESVSEFNNMALILPRWRLLIRKIKGKTKKTKSKKLIIKAKEKKKKQLDTADPQTVHSSSA